MKTTIIHISEFKGAKRVKTCDGTLNQPPGNSDENPKELCEQCRIKFIRSKDVKR